MKVLASIVLFASLLSCGGCGAPLESFPDPVDGFVNESGKDTALLKLAWSDAQTSLSTQAVDLNAYDAQFSGKHRYIQPNPEKYGHMHPQYVVVRVRHDNGGQWFKCVTDHAQGCTNVEVKNARGGTVQLVEVADRTLDNGSVGYLPYEFETVMLSYGGEDISGR